MDLGISGRNALVCASTGGLGEATARALAADGANVVVSGRRGDRAKAIAEELPGAVGVEADLTADDGAQRLLSQATEALGEIDILVLNGPGPRPGTASEMTAEDSAGAVANLLLVQQTLVRGVLPGMRERCWGRILAIASSGVAAPIPNLALSNIGRGALAAYLKSLATEVADEGVTANLLLPGRIATDRLTALDTATSEREGVSFEEARARGEAAIPAGRYGQPAEFGAAAAFLCSAHAGYITGTMLRCDGGLVPTL